jgi:two-component system cell cycle sensor histidine kinase/response regulator CckA
MRDSVSWKPWLFAALAVLAGLITEQVLEGFYHQRWVESERRKVAVQLAELRSRLEGVINGNLLMVHGLSAVIAANPEIDQAMFSRIAAGMIGKRYPLRNIAGAPDLIIRLMHPVAGNEGAVGLDYRSHPQQRAQALKAVEDGEIVIAGPLSLVQGGTGLIAREPVFLPPVEPGGEPRLWGLVSAVFDVDRLLDLGGVNEARQKGGLDIAIRGTDGRGAEGDTFFGVSTLFDTGPVSSTISLPSGQWQIAAAPIDGWQNHRKDHVILDLRVAALLITAAFAVLIFKLSRKSEIYLRTAAELRESQALFAAFMDNLPIGAFVQESGSGRTVFENRWLSSLRSSLGRECIGPVDGVASSAPDDAGTAWQRLTLANDSNRFCDRLRFTLVDRDGNELVGGLVMDVSERVAAQQALARSEARLHALLDTIPDLVWMKDPDGVYLACNARFESFFGAGARDIVGRTDHDFVPSELADFFREHDQAAMTAGGPTMNEERITFASDGHEELLETIKAPVLDRDGRLIGVLGIGRDITERDAMNRELRGQLEELTRWQSVVLGREDRIQELKREVNELASRSGKAIRYPSVEDGA